MHHSISHHSTAQRSTGRRPLNVVRQPSRLGKNEQALLLSLLRPFYSVAFYLFLILFISCHDEVTDAPGYDPTYGTGTAPSVVSVFPVPGSADIDTISRIVVTYDMPIYVAPIHSVKINEVYADSAYVEDGNKMVVVVHTVGNTTYNVTIKSPTVRNATYAFARDYQFSFTTRIYNNFDPTPFTLDTELTNPDATAKTKAVYAYLLSQFGKATLSATMSDPAWDNRLAEQLYNTTGRYPAIHTYDYIFLRWSRPMGNANWIDYTDTTPVEQWAAAGGLVSVGWHWNVPKTEADRNNLDNYAFYVDGNTFGARNALRAGRWENAQINEDLAVMASHLRGLQDKGITVLFRPLHEASGKWFWWGTDGAAQYKKLWQYVYNYMKEAGVNNLIWVWTSQGDDANWYPGAEYVDIVGCDLYDTENHASRRDKWDQLLAITKGRKMLTLSECGQIPEIGNTFAGGDVWSWFMPWNDIFMTDAYNTADFFTRQMNSPYVITRDELPSFDE